MTQCLIRKALLIVSVCVSMFAPQVTTPVWANNDPVFSAAAAIVDITPKKLPVFVNGGFFPRSVDEVLDPLHARAIVLHDGNEQIAMIVVDTCLLPKSIADTAKELIADRTGIRKDRVMISATHCHSAPSLLAALGTPADADYVDFLPKKIAEAVAAAQTNLKPAKIGWAVGNDRNNVYNRRFLMQEGTAMANRFGGKLNDRAMMNPGHANPNKIARTGPVDTAVSVISIVDKNDKPIALFANYSTHYAGVPGDVLSGDYFAVFAERIKAKIAEKIGNENMPDSFVAIMSNGTSGDANCIDFLNANRQFDYKTVGEETAAAAMAVWSNIQYFDHVPLGMTERRITLNNRVPSADEVAAAKKHIAELPNGEMKTVEDVYAMSTIMMADWPSTDTAILQAIRIGELGITALPAEVYAVTGLEIKARSPFTPTINIGLANDYLGYVPPPEQHALGGYNTWRTQSSCLDIDAEPQIKATALELLHELKK